MSEQAHLAAHRAAEFAARASYGRLLAALVRRTRDLASAEDALADAFAAALEAWPRVGIPDAPESWLLAVARRKAADVDRHAAVRSRPDVLAALTPDPENGLDAESVMDDRLRLMLVCAHPAIDEAVRPALILQAVLGVHVKDMASAFVLPTETLTKRLVRAKAKIRLAGLRFEEPEASDLPMRLHTLLESIYAAFFLGKESMEDDGDSGDELRREAFYLARVVADSLPDDPEAMGFLALIHFVEARRAAQVNDAGRFVPLLEQNPEAWDRDRMNRGYELLAHASKRNSMGPFQLEAAIHAAHCYRARSGTVPWKEIAALYGILVSRYPTVGARVGLGLAVAHAEANPAAGIAMLLQLDERQVRSYQPWWVAMAHLHGMQGEHAEEKRCLAHAMGLTRHPKIREFLQERLRRDAPDPVSCRTSVNVAS